MDAYDYPTACNDFNVFSTQFGLPTADCTKSDDPHFRVVYATGSKPRSNCGWAQEAALDIEWAHAMAPDAQIILVEAASNNNSDLLNAVSVASNLVAPAGGGQVSMSWGSSEFSGESTYDSDFSTTGVTYFASSGDTGGKVIWPSVSANVISAGGTSVNRDASGKFTAESAWSSAGGGPSKYVYAPIYQSGIQTLADLLNGYRGTPDISFDADPYTGVSVYDSTSCQGYSGWMVFGGTSVSAPSLAGIFNLAGAFNGGWDSGGNTSSVQDTLYKSYDAASSGGKASYTEYFYDVTSGSAGSYPAGSDWDYATGIGTVRGVSGLAGSTTPSFSLSASPSSLSVTAGDHGASTISVTPSGGYTGNVTLSGLSTLPTGMNVTFNTNPVDITGASAVSSTMTVSTTASTPAGTYNLVIQGSDGNLSNSVTVPVTVSAASTGGSISLSGLDFSVKKGSSQGTTVTVTANGGFSGPVNLSVSGLPPQSSGSFSPSSVTLGSTTSADSTLTVTTGAHTPTKSYVLTITGTDSTGKITASTTVNLTVVK